MAHQRHNSQDRPLVVVDQTDDADEWGPEPPAQVELGGNLRGAVERAAANEERLVVREGDEELAAIIPMEDFRLLLRLEEEELDRIDIEESRKALADPENQTRIPLAQVRAELGR